VAGIRVLVVDDNEPWRRCIRLTLFANERLHILGEVRDGVEAVEKARELQPDLILLDIGLPKLNGIEAVRQIREVSRGSKILFLSQNRSWEVVAEALRSGGNGYVLKSDAARELLPAIEAVLGSTHFVSSSLAGYGLSDPKEADRSNPPRRNPPLLGDDATPERHEVGFYSDDQTLLNALTQFVASTLRVGDAAVVVATEPHRDSLLISLQQNGFDMASAVEQGRYVAFDAAGALSAVMLNTRVDPVRFLALLGNLIVTAGEAAKAGPSRVRIFGECVELLCAQGKVEAAIQFEKLGNQLAQIYDIDILCGYSLGRFQSVVDSQIFHRICAVHSAVHSW
jgi:DNA-binding NarL/FixJ family response regulator